MFETVPERRKFPDLPWFTIPGVSENRLILPLSEDELRSLYPLTHEEPFWGDLKDRGESAFLIDHLLSFCRALSPLAHRELAVPGTKAARLILHYLRRIHSIEA